ncbi:hypothetical protein BKA57DRAFT_507710 [Linnemannia elongata]|nr:hypothetical protein BKA57DRAFT_507710 [Linnemannia elongata]
MSALNPSTTTLITNATGKVIALPELIEHIVHYIPPTDLLTCTQVSRLYIDTRNVPLWVRIFKDTVAETAPRSEVNARARTIFGKNGHHILHMSLN